MSPRLDRRLESIQTFHFVVIKLQRLRLRPDRRNFVRVLGFRQRALIIGNLSKYIIFYDGSQTAYFFYFIYSGPNPMLFCLISVGRGGGVFPQHFGVLSINTVDGRGNTAELAPSPTRGLRPRRPSERQKKHSGQ